MSPIRGIKGLVSSGQAGSETWLPVPALSASGGRRVLYGTVALSPQLVQLELDEAQAAQEHLQKHYPGTWLHVPMEAWYICNTLFSIFVVRKRRELIEKS